MLIVDVDIGIVLFDFLMNPVPEIGLIDEDVGFGAECQDFLLISLPTVFKGIANTAFNTFAGFLKRAPLMKLPFRSL